MLYAALPSSAVLKVSRVLGGPTPMLVKAAIVTM